MRTTFLTIPAIVLLAFPAAARAEEMLLKNPEGIMCRDPASLAEFAANDGSVKKGVTASASSDVYRRFTSACSDGGDSVHVVTKRQNTSIVTFRNGTWYVPNVAYMTPTPDCLREGARVSFTGTVGTGIHHDGEDDVKGSRYPRLVLDKPVCYLGNNADPAARYVSLVPISNPRRDYPGIMALMGKHATVTGTIENPTTMHQPQDLMMMTDPVIGPAP